MALFHSQARHHIIILFFLFVDLDVGDWSNGTVFSRKSDTIYKKSTESLCYKSKSSKTFYLSPKEIT